MGDEKVLMIGGPVDGKRISVNPEVSFVEIPGEVCVRYRRVQMQSTRGMKTAVYVCGDIDPLVALIDGYRRGGNRESA